MLPERSSRANTGLSASLEAELRDLERHWEDLDRADAQNAAQAQPAAHDMVALHLTFWPSQLCATLGTHSISLRLSHTLLGQ